MQNFILIMHESASAPSKNSHHWNQLQNTFPTVYDMTICMKSPFLAKFGLNYAEIHSNYAWFNFNITKKDFHYWYLLLNTFPTIYDKAKYKISPFLAKFGLNYAEIHPNYAWLKLTFTQKYSHHWNQLQNTFLTVYNMTIRMKSPFLTKFGLNYALIMRKLANYAWPGHHLA